MATKNFSVKNGLTVGNVIIDAGTNSIAGIDSITALQALLTDITTTGNANLGNVANVHIGGGLAKQLLQTDGNGGLSWYSYTPDSGLTAAVDVFTGSGDTATYTLSLNPASENFTTVVIDGVTQLKTTYSVSGTTLTIGANLPPFARMEVTTLVGYGNSALTATVDTYLGNGNANTYQLSVTPPSVGATSVIIDGVSQLKNAYVLDGQQIILGEALPADSVLEITTLIGADLSPNYANYAGEANIANTAYSVSVANVSGIGNIATVNLDGNASNVLTGSGTWVNITASDNANYANYSGEAAIANLATYATTANSVAGANVIGTVANATSAATANSVDAANITGTISFATSSTTANTAATVTANAQPNITSVGELSTLTVIDNVTAANFLVASGGSIGINPQGEIHVAKNGSDTTGVGSVSNPYRTISYALTLAGSGTKIIVHAGNYNEDVTVANLASVAISAYQPGASNPQTYSIIGNVTTSGNTGGLLLHSVGVIGNLTHASTGSFFIKDIQLGSGANTTTFTKSGSGYLEVTGGDWQGGNAYVNITGAGPAVFDNVKLSNVTVNNASASTLIRNSTTVINTTLISGTLTVVASTLYGNSNTAAAITTAAGTLNLQNLLILRANATAGLMTIGASTAYIYDDIYFDKANSALGGIPIANTIYAGPVDFQAIRADSIALSANISATRFIGSGANLTAIAGANVTGIVANATMATTAGTVTTAAQPNITLTGTLTSLNVSGNITVNSKQAVNGPAFAVYADSTTQTIVSSTQTKVLFQVEEFDTNSNFANSRFTPTVEGYYQLNSEIRIGGPSDTGESMMGIWKNGSEYRRGYNSSGTEQGANFYSMGVSTLVYANGSTDYFEVYAQQSSGSSKDITTVNASYLTWFNGTMLRGA
jgi:hypothetical protein